MNVVFVFFVSLIFSVSCFGAEHDAVGAMPADSMPARLSREQKDSVRLELKRAIADPSRDIFLVDLQYQKYGPITSFRDDRFRVWDSKIYLPVDSIAGLYEYRTSSGLGALLGAACTAVAIALAYALPQPSADYIFGQLAFCAIPIGWFIGSIFTSSTSWPITTFK